MDETKINKQIFLSYGSPDKPFVRKLSADLRQVGISVWFDEWEVKVGDSITGAVNEAIVRSSFFGAVLSSDSVKRPWVQKELQTAMHFQVEGKLKILPILITDSSDIPPFIGELRYADFSGAYRIGLRDLILAIDPPKASSVNILNTDTSVVDKIEWFREEFSLAYLKENSDPERRYYFNNPVMNEVIFEQIKKEINSEEGPLGKSKDYSSSPGSAKGARAFIRDGLMWEAIYPFWRIYNLGFFRGDKDLATAEAIKNLFIQGNPEFEELLFALAKKRYFFLIDVYPTFGFVNEKFQIFLLDKIIGYFERFSLFEQTT